MELEDALLQIAEIRQQIARTEVFRGYRSVPVVLSSLLAVLGALAQARWLDHPREQLSLYLLLWVSVGVVSGLVAFSGMWIRAARTDSPLVRLHTGLALEQFLPALAAGALVTFLIARYAVDVAWMLPGLWQIFLALGVFASCRLLPRATFLVGVFYLLSGASCLVFGQGALALSPWAMGVPFGIGQALAAGILYFTLERAHDTA